MRSAGDSRQGCRRAVPPQRPPPPGRGRAGGRCAASGVADAARGEWLAQWWEAVRRGNSHAVRVLAASPLADVAEGAAVAAKTGDARALGALRVAAPTRVGEAGRDGRTAAHWCAFHAHDVALEALLCPAPAAVDVDARGGVEQRTALHAAVVGSRPPAKGTSSAYIQSRHQRARRCVALLLAAGASVNAADARGETATHFASFASDVTLLKDLLAWGADANTADAGGRSALALAAARGSVDVCGTLLDAGADPGLGDRDGLLPAHLAAQRGQADVLRLLLDAGGWDTSAVDTKRGLDALGWARAFGEAACVDLLLQPPSEPRRAG